MKKTFIISFLILATAFNFSACKSEGKKEEKKNNGVFKVAKAKNEINFIAYKTTEKKPVKGRFKTINVLSGGEGNNVKEAINNTEFEIPVSSLLTKDTSRDFKIKKFFFGVMENTKLLSGKLMITDNVNGEALITMNGITKKVPFTYTIVEKTFHMQTTIDVNDWNASAALSVFNKACEDLHEAEDGISKTWSEVDLDITTIF